MSDKKHGWLKRIGVFSLLLLRVVAAPAQSGAAQMASISYYSDAFHKRLTASGERYHKDSMTAAHRALPFGTRIRITNPENNQTVVVRVNDRTGGRKRTIDVSGAAARALGMTREGVITAQVEILGKAQPEIKDTLITSSEPDITSKGAIGAGYKVQVGAFRNRGNADHGEAKLKKAGFDNVEVSEGAPMYRVLVGPYSSRTEAQKALQALKKKKFLGKVVKE